MITNPQFDRLTLDEKRDIINEFGELLSSIKTSFGTRSLYLLKGLFIETFYNNRLQLVFDINRLENNEPILYRYLTKA